MGTKDNNLKKQPLNCCYSISKFSQHQALKDMTLMLVNSQESKSIVNNQGYYSDNIFRTDWHLAQDYARPWVNILKPSIDQHMSAVMESLGYAQTELDNMWFQQYNKGSGHGWHVHMFCQWTNVYYLDFPQGSPKTQLVSPFDQSTIFEVDVEEGDILTFPSIVIHRAPAVETDNIKTIVSFNLNSSLITTTVLEEING